MKESENVEVITRMSYNMPKMLGYKLQSPSIKNEDVCHDWVTDWGSEVVRKKPFIELDPLGQLNIDFGEN